MTKGGGEGENINFDVGRLLKKIPVCDKRYQTNSAIRVIVNTLSPIRGGGWMRSEVGWQELGTSFHSLR